MERPGRRSLRLAGWDYASAGAYFVTICSHQRELLFVNPILASILETEWRSLPARFSAVELDAFVVMPNHVHFILWLRSHGTSTSLSLAGESVGAPLAGAPTPQEPLAPPPNPASVGAGASPAPTDGTLSLGAVVGAYKSLVAVNWLRWLKENDQTSSGRVWQRNYYERIIRDQAELDRVRKYVANNPTAWQFDSENPACKVDDGYDLSWAWLESAPE